MVDENQPRTLGDYSRPSHEGYRNTIELPKGDNVVPLRPDTIRLVQKDVHSMSFATRHAIDHSTGGKLRDKSVKESWKVIDDLALYDNESWNYQRDFTKIVKAIYLPQDVLSASDRHLIELENQVQRLMEAHLAHKPSVHVNKIAFSCEIYGGPYNTRYCMENPKQAFLDYASLRIDEAGAHAPMYNTILDRYVETLELSKNGSAFIQSEMPKKIKDPRLFILPYKLGDSKPFDTLSDLGSCVNLIPLYLFKTLKIRLLKKTKNVLGLADGTKSYHIGIVRNVEVYVGKLKLLEDFYVIDMENDLMCPLLIGRGFLVTASAVIDCKKSKIAVTTIDAVVVRDFYKKFYNSIGRVPNRCSSSIGKTRGLLSFSRRKGFRKFVAYFDPHLSMNIITHKAINTIMVNQQGSMDDNFVAIVGNVQVFVGSITYTTDFIVFEDIEKYIEIGLSKFEEEETETMREPTMEEYMTKTREGYGSGIARPKIKEKDHFELKGLTIITLNFLSQVDHGAFNIVRIVRCCPPARTAKKMEEINNFQQDPGETLYQAWERFKELLLRCPQHYLTDMHEVISFYKGLDVPTRQILDSKVAIPSMKAAYKSRSLDQSFGNSNRGNEQGRYAVSGPRNSKLFFMPRQVIVPFSIHLYDDFYDGEEGLSLDPLYGDYIELNKPLELRRNQVNDLESTIKEGDVIDELMMDIVKTREACVKEKRFDGMITIYKRNNSVTYQIARPLVKVSSHEKLKGQKLEAWRSQEKSESVTVDRGRKTEGNTKRRAENAYVKVYSSFKERNKKEGLEVQLLERSKWRAIAANIVKM
uniref:MAK10-like protein n=1 Tax=Tanacetum cinerariifolium TaxID=118510 RepID=A0A699GNM2_TANCI|nr:MAK10-like protein [Tanacetum cinerariifolium]